MSSQPITQEDAKEATTIKCLRVLDDLAKETESAGYTEIPRLIREAMSQVRVELRDIAWRKYLKERGLDDI